MQQPGVIRAETVHVFLVGNGLDHFGGVNMFRQRHLHQNAVDLSFIVQTADQFQQIGFRGFLRQMVNVAGHAQRLRRLLFVAVVNDTGRIAADQNNRQIRLDLPAGDFSRQPVSQTFGNRLAVNNLCRHIPCSILANAGGRLRRRF